MSSKSCPLAIVGISCLFPKADGLQAYWANIKNGVDAITPIPAGSHWNVADYFDADPKSADRTYAQRGGFLSPLDFNPMEFGMAPKDIEATDTSQLLSLVAAQRALADAGYAAGTRQGREYDRMRTSVILGVTGALELVIPLGARLGHPIWRKALAQAGVDNAVAEDVVQRISDSYVGWQENSFPGLLGNVAAGRIASRLDLGGTNCVVDAACASSLAAIHLAGLELSTGRSDLVITGGVDTFNDIFMYMCFSKTPALSPSGDAKPFDRDCDGTVIGEGLGLLVLKRLADAERDGDRVYAVLKGMGSSSDGRSSAIYAPRAGGQKLALQRAYADSGVTPETIGLLEAHGTGTKVGDATELSSLIEVFRSSRQTGSWCALGSVKSQIGHTKAAAGVAGVIKAAMALHRKVLPPTIKVSQPIEDLVPGRSPFYINTSKRPWLPSDQHPRRAGVSALGFGGTNFHCVLEEHCAAKPGADWDGDVQLLAFSSQQLSELKSRISAHAADAPWLEFRREAHRSREQFQRDANLRLLMIVSSTSDRASLKSAALKMLEANPDRSSWMAPAGIAFGSGKRPGKLGALFPGQGSQYPGMLRDLACQFPVMLDALAEADSVFARERSPGDTRRLSDFLYPQPVFSDHARREQEEALKATDIAQPALGAVGMGASKLLAHFGVAADAACGHSYGELLALWSAGRIETHALHQLSNLRGRLMASRNANGSRGAMLAVQADEQTVLDFLRDETSPLVVANRNSPKQYVLAGPVEDIETALGALTERSIRSRRLPVSAAFHSLLVADACAPFAAALEDIAFAKGAIPVYANSSGREYPKSAAQARELLASQIIRPVNFMAQVQAMHADGVRTFIEIGPGHVLCDLVQSILPGNDVAAIALDSSKGSRSGAFDLALALGRLASLGHEVDLTKWENAPAPLEDGAKKPAFTVAISGANYRAPHAARAPVTPKPAPVQAPRAAIAATPDQIPAALRAAQEGIVALQRLQAQTAQLHQQFLEGQESARRTIQSLLGLRSSTGAQTRTAAPLAMAPVAPAPAAELLPVQGIDEAPVPEPAVRPAAASPVASFERAVLEVVAEKTGYPAEMLTLGMGLDSDLGIDSIKRVEIMAALRGRLPDAPEIKPEHLGSLQTLEQVVAFLAGGASTRAEALPAVQASVPSGTQVSDALLAVVAEKTGYPVEMLDMGMGMDSDLGIDSIKRVEIMASLRAKLPDSPEIKPEHLGALQTLQQVVDFLSGSNSGPSTLPVKSDTRAAGASRASAVLLAVVAEKTGYPVEMLNLGMGMDSDLGIDSIKRVEIMAALRSQLPGSPEIKPEHLGSLQTLQHIVDFLNAGPALAPQAAPSAAAVQAAPPELPQSAPRFELQRQVVVPVALAEFARRESITLPAGAHVWMTDDGTELSAAVDERLRAKGMIVHRGDLQGMFAGEGSAPPAALVIIAPAGGCGESFLWRALRLIQRAGPSLRAAGNAGAAILVTVSRLDGAFGFGNLGAGSDPVSGGLAGLVKTARREWPEVRCKALDLDPASRNDAAAEQIVDEMFRSGPVEVGLSGQARVSLELAPVAVAGGDNRSALVQGDVVIVSGGARGVTGEAAVALARAFRPTLVLLGRTRLAEREPAWLQDLQSEAGIKQALFVRADGGGSPKAVEAKYRDLLAQREIRAQLGRLEAAGAKAVYHPVDVRDAAAVARVVTDIRRQHGAIRGLVHGAGVLADRRIEDKTEEQFELVYATKARGLQSLLCAMAHDKLKVIALFSSSTGRFGRIGQADYAAANEVLNKLAQVEARLRPECRVVSINWGPWNGGMVTPGLRKVFEQENVGLIEPEAGGGFFVREISSSSRDAVEVVALAPPPRSKTVAPPSDRISIPGTPESTVAFEREVNVKALPCLQSHVINGRAVLPAALTLEWLAQAALHGNPGMAFYGLDNFQVLKGVIVDGEQTINVSLRAGCATRRANLLVVPVQMTSENGGRRYLHAQADVLLTAEKLPAAPAPELTSISGGGFADAYGRGVLFHGTALHGIERVEGCAEQGVAAVVKASPSPKKWMQNPLRGTWISDPLALDSAFQMMILWSQAHRGAPSLPSALKRYRQFVAAFPKSGCRVVIAVALGITAITVATIEFLDGQGNVLAAADGCECVVDAGLNDAFRANRLKIDT